MRGASTMTDRIGQKIGNYRLVRLLGQGGFAEVYLAEHLYLGSFAAIKLLYVRVAQEDITQFQQEGRMLAALEHPHIVRVLDFGIEDSTPYLIMAYAPGVATAVGAHARHRHPGGHPRLDRRRVLPLAAGVPGAAAGRREHPGGRPPP